MADQYIRDNAQQQGVDLGAVLAVQAMQQEIDLHRQHDKSRSYLGQAINFIWRQDENRLNDLEQLKDKTETALQSGTVGDTKKLVQDVQEKITRDQKAIGLQDEIGHYGSTLLKVGALFYGGKVGWGATGALYALDQANPNDSFGTQLIDGSLGAVKGVATKGIIGSIGSQPWNFGAKGAVMGIANRIVDEGLTRQTYLDSSTGEFSFSAAGKKMLNDSFNLHAIATDVLVFGAAAGIGEVATTIAPKIAESPLVNTVMTSSTFGVASGSINEYERQRQSGQQIDWSKVAMRGGLEGAVYALAAVPGGLQAEAAMNERMKEMNERARQLNERMQLLKTLRESGDLSAERAVSIDGRTVRVAPNAEQAINQLGGDGGANVFGRDANGDYIRVSGSVDSTAESGITVNGSRVKLADGKVYVHPSDEIVFHSGEGQAQKVILSFNGSEATAEPVQQYLKVATVKAEILKEPLQWRTGKGEPMEGAVGDYKVTNADGSFQTVKPNIFGQTYIEVPGKLGEFTKVPTNAQVLDKPIVIQTREGQGTGNPGDYLVTGPDGDQYVVTREKFEKLYRPMPVVEKPVTPLTVEEMGRLYDRLKAEGREYTFEKRMYEASIRPAQAGEKLITIQGDESTAEPGMMRVTRPMLDGRVDEYFIFPDKLLSRWVPAGGQQPGEAGIYTPKPGGITKMVELDGPATIKPSWSKTPFTGSLGDFLATYGAGDFNIVHVPALADTYVGVDPASLAKSEAAVRSVQARAQK